MGNIDDFFKDIARISSWAQESVLTAYQENIICGYPDNTFKPLALASRAEAATTIIKTLALN